MDKPFVILIHGLLSDGAWHEKTEAVLRPYFRCISIRYRDYHALGPVNIFFWPWSLQLGALLGWYATRQNGLIGLSLVCCLGFAVIGLIEAAWSGIARAVPWLLVAAFCWSAVPVDRNNVTFILVLAAASLSLHLLGEMLRRRIKRSLFFVAVFWGGLVALIPVLAYAAGWALQFVTVGGMPGWLPFRSPEIVLLALLVLLNTLNISFREWQWNRSNSYWFVPVAMGAFGLAGAWLIGPAGQAGQCWALWIGLLLLMCFLEVNESLGNRPADRNWRYEVFVVAVAAGIVWGFGHISILWTAVAVLMLFGSYEPILRAKRVAQNVHDLVTEARHRFQIDGRVHVIAHSLGAFLAGKNLDKFQLEPYGQVILVGGAISERRVWIGDFDGPAPRIDHIRNEHGALDFVIKLLWLSGAWANHHRMGGAGFIGISADFAGVPVHLIPDFRARCATCPAPPARIHNYHFPFFTHTSYTSLAPTHCWEFWLPCLWGFSPSEVHGFHRICFDVLAARLKEPFAAHQFNNRLDEFLDSDWDLGPEPGPPQPLRELIRNVVNDQLEVLDESHPTNPLPSDVVVRIAAMILYIRISRGIRARMNGMDPGRDILYLNPGDAIIQASKRACQIVTVQLN